MRFSFGSTCGGAGVALYPQEYNNVNVGGTVALMTAVRDVGVPRVVLASSATVYGEQPSQPVHENLRPNPRSAYAVTKIAAEHYLFTLGALYGCQTVALRIFNVYGPGQRISPSRCPGCSAFPQADIGGWLVGDPRRWPPDAVILFISMMSCMRSLPLHQRSALLAR